MKVIHIRRDRKSESYQLSETGPALAGWASNSPIYSRNELSAALILKGCTEKTISDALKDLDTDGNAEIPLDRGSASRIS
jgi:hypothetical protein